ncbi:MAG TPA: GNAT family N-acetyltransferase [Saprospiraceae bacterium]|nr:GNAT family N-acetyltransferase [Saprospiraceae bacterium]
MKPIETDRLIICELNISDAPFILKLLNTPSWIKYIGDRNIKTIQDAENYLTSGPIESYNKNGFGLFKIELKDNNHAIGMCGLIKRDVLDDIDLGFALLPEYEAKGYAYEASMGVLKMAKSDLNLNTILAITLPENTSSINLLKKIGLQFERLIKLKEDSEDLMLFSMSL